MPDGRDGDRATDGPARDGGDHADAPRGSGHAPHGIVLTFPYPDAGTARVVERSVRQEVDDIEGDRTRATVTREGDTLVVDVVAEDLVALRAGLNTWCTLVEVAERSVEASES